MKWKTSKRWMALILSLLMVLSAIPLDVFGSAEEAADVETIPEEITEEAVEEPVEAPAEEPAAVPSAEEETVIQGAEQGSFEAEPTTVYTYEDEEKTVVATLTDGSAIPEGSQLFVRTLTDSTTDQDELERFNWVDSYVKEQAADNDFVISGCEYYDIYFLYEDQEIVPSAGEMYVEILYKDGKVPESYRTSTQTGKEVKIYQLGEYLNENSEIIYQLDDLLELGRLNNLNAAEDGTVLELGVNETAFLPIALVWKEDPQPVEHNENEVTAESAPVTNEGSLPEEETAFDETYQDEDVEIHVSADEGVIPEGADLAVVPIRKQEIPEDASAEEKAALQEMNQKYDETKSHLDADADTEKEIEGFVAYDISFMRDGEEVEPNGNVDVTMNFINPVLPEGVSEDAEVVVNHLEKDAASDTGIKVVDITEESEVVTSADGVAVEKIALVTESFSTFVVRWDKSNSKCATVYYVNENGKEITGSKKSQYEVSDKEWLTLDAGFAGEIDGYEFKEARLNTYDGTKAAQIKYDGGWKYRSTSGSSSQSISGWKKDKNYGDRKIYLVYGEKSTDELTEVETVDSNAAGITMRMIDYNSEAWANDYGNGNVKQGLASRTLNKDGYPVGTGDGNRGKNFSQWFGGGTAVNHLFLKDTYDQTGYYEYSSFQNYAYLGDNSDFTVYEQIGTPRTGESIKNYFYYRGNFMPYNEIAAGKLSSHTNLFDENGNSLPTSDPRYGEKLYKTQGKNNFYFGMYLEANFLQMPNGKVEHKGEESPMIYEFNGDDDLWVYIDGVLVLDIGGCHDAHSGYINFNTGAVHVELGNGTQDTTIKDLFRLAGKFPNGDDWKEREAGQHFDGNTLKDYSAHNMKMFYMERGAGASNLHMKFNLPVIPEGQITVEKQLTQETDPIKYGDVEFGFKLYVENADSTTGAGLGTFRQVTDLSSYTAEKILADSTTDSLSLDSQGRFYLKPKEKAVFNNIPKNLKYYVQEVDVRSEEYDQVTINGTTVVTPDGEESFTATAPKATVSSRPWVTFRNSCSAANLRSLTVKKVMANNETSSDDFTVNVKLENSYGELENYEGSYRLFTGESADYETLTAVEGNITIKANQSVVINNIISGTDFQVTELDPGEQYNSPVITVEGNDPAEENVEGSMGSIKLGENSVVTVTNEWMDDEAYVQKDVEYSKDAKLTNWDDRTYEIILGAKSKVTKVGKGSADIVLLLDNSSSMTNSSYGGKKRWQNLKEAVESFIDSTAENSPTSKIAIVTFDKDSTERDILADFTTVGDGSNLHSAMDQYSIGSGTRQDLGLANVENLLNNHEGTNPRYVILFTDGEPYPANIRDTICQDAYDTSMRIKENVSVYTVGLAMSSGLTCSYTLADGTRLNKVSVLEWLNSLASDSDHAINVADTANLTDIFNDIQQSISQNVKVTIKDVVDARFKVTDEEKDRLRGLGASVTENANGTTTVEWPVTATKDGWTGSIHIVAKDEYIGGNDVTTNVESESTITYEGKEVPLTNDTPTVNVKAELKINNAETTIFLGDTVPTDEAILKRLFDSGYTIGRDGGELKASDFVKEWYKDEACSQPVTLEDMARIAPTDTQKFYLKVTYDAGAPTEESTGRTDGNIAGGDDHIVTAVNSDTKNYKDKEYGVYTVYVVDGQLTITKKIDEQYTHIKPINANQSFVFKIQKYAVNADGSRGDLVNTFYEVINFNANESGTEKTKTISGLSKGYYTVTEETEWSAKYNLVSQVDNFEENTDECVDLYIGKKLESSNDKLSFYGVGNTEENEKHANVLVASTEFTNNVDREWKWLSDTAAAVNKFNQ